MHNNDIENLFSSPSGCNWDLNERWDLRTNIGFSHKTTDAAWAGSGSAVDIHHQAMVIHHLGQILRMILCGSDESQQKKQDGGEAV